MLAPAKGGKHAWILPENSAQDEPGKNKETENSTAQPNKTLNEETNKEEEQELTMQQAIEARSKPNLKFKKGLQNDRGKIPACPTRSNEN